MKSTGIKRILLLSSALIIIFFTVILGVILLYKPPTHYSGTFVNSEDNRYGYIY